MMSKEWKDIPGWEGFYQASTEGEIRSLTRQLTQQGPHGPYTRTFNGRVLTAAKYRNGYLFVVLSRQGIKPKQCLIHRLVALAFLGVPSVNQEVCHVNGIRNDNRLCNLRWDTRKNNHADKVLHGTAMIGEKNPQAKLTEFKVIEIRQSSLTQKELAEIHGVSISTISEIRNRKSWRWLDLQLDPAPEIATWYSTSRLHKARLAP